jgi:hypothetical protein
VFETRMLRGLFGPKRQEITRQWGKFHNEKPHDLYSLPNTDMSDKTKEAETSRASSMDGKDEKCIKILIRKPEGNGDYS